MHKHTLETLQHSHDFTAIHEHGEKRTQQVLVLTAITMVVEIAAGTAFGSMALLADGWHMGTHVAAFLITIFAYRYTRKHAHSPEFTFGTGKVSVLGGFASAVALGVVALVMLAESVHRMFQPQPISFNEAIGVAFLGLLINIISALLLQDRHDHGHDDHQHHDHNLKAAYMHVLADALTSVLAIIALIAGKFLGWHQLDPVMGIVGAVVISRWSYTLIQETSPILLDGSIAEDYQAAIRERIESADDNRIADIHVWRVGPADYAAIIVLVTHTPRNPDHYKKMLADFSQLSHITVEINQCSGESCMVPR
ncbi:MAG: CDF family Co(II)/Ni(II) efflux transporter DmeF [Proteobacteria bacterium]|nr:CDF family Co(II)/Ni(II) efflux transporter DmeF [Pseudomonadota bacterium]MBU4296112.1 CDF family Co(II)/Ni(II) efflux transporter DmeF [Pseudomonadota bacterium]MCG2746739.1 CDF family Co(II)/Ni(II) efflux transporter DmeF [Desulfobulbaceae bacterium]